MMKRSEISRKTPMNRGTSVLARSAMRRSNKRKHKIEGHHDQKMLDACQGEPCYLIVPGCGLCHYWLDFGTTATRDEKRGVFFDALARWQPVRDGVAL